MGPLLGRGAPCQAISLSSYTKGTSRQATMAPCQTKRAPRQAHGDPYKAIGTLSKVPLVRTRYPSGGPLGPQQAQETIC